VFDRGRLFGWQVVDFGEGGPLRCGRCKAYINPFMRFVDGGRRFQCNMCGFVNDCPREYQCNLRPDGRRQVRCSTLLYAVVRSGHA
jgi:hypothetical protein